MTKQILILSFLFLMPALMMAQDLKLSKDFKVTPSTPYPVVDAGSKLYFALEDGKTISVKTRGETATIQRFDTRSMKEISRKEYKDLPKYTKVQKILQIRGKLFYIYEAYNKKSKEKSFTLYIREIDTQKGTFMPEKELFTTSGPVMGQPFSWGATGLGVFGWGGAPKFDVSTSFDDSKILVRFRHKPTKKNDSKSNDRIGFYVYDQDFKKIWGEDVTMPYTEKAMNNLAYMVKSNGTAAMLIYKNESKSFELLTLKSGGDKMTVNKLAVKKGLIFAKFDLREDVDGNIAAAGFYANGIEFKWSWGGGSTSFNCNGLYYFTMTDEGKILNTYDHEFPLEFIQQYTNKRERNKAEKRESKGKAGMEEVKMSEFFTQEDGSSIFLAEQWYVRKEMMGTSTQNVWHYRHMIAMKLDADGKLVWMKKLPKNQAGTSGQGQMSFKYVPGNGCHYLLYVGNPKNADLPIDKVPAAHKNGMGGYLTAYKVDDETGKVEKHTILDMVKVDGKKMTAYQFNVKRIFEAEDKVFMLEIYIKGKKDAMIKMELK